MWQVQLSDGNGALISGAELRVSPYKPTYQHGSAEVVVSDLGDGRYELAPIEVTMPGIWEIPVSITSPSGDSGDVMFRFCIAEH